MKYAPPATACQHVPVAHSPVGHVSMCPDCGVVHVSLQYFSMRFDMAAFGVLAQMLAQAQDRLQGVQEASRPATDTLGSSALDESPLGRIH